MHKQIIVLCLLVVGAAGWFVYDKNHHPAKAVDSQSSSVTTTKKNSSAAKPITDNTAPPADTACTGNSISQKVIVSVSQQHMWVCSGAKVVYDNPVITGMTQYGDSTPLGTYSIYGKLTDQTLKGCDPSGCWNDPVSYWMPYQQASGGTVGFHDATWRAPSDFGHIAPSSGKGSHGCVEMPLAAAKWLYNWAAVGTSVTIEA